MDTTTSTWLTYGILACVVLALLWFALSHIIWIGIGMAVGGVGGYKLSNLGAYFNALKTRL